MSCKYNQYSTIDVTETLPSTSLQQEKGQNRLYITRLYRPYATEEL